MDVVALAQYGVRNVVATLGTATTVDHLQMLFRQVDEVVFCFDGDSAGLKAAWKALELSLPMMEQTRSVKFLLLPEGEDPDSVVRKEGAEGFLQRSEQALTLSQFWLQGLQNKLSVPITSREGRQQLVALAQPYVQTAQGLYQYLLVEAVAEAVDLPTWRLEKQMGVKTGFAQYKQPVKVRADANEPVSQIMSLSKHLVCILLVRPGWAAALNQAIGATLSQSQRRDDRLLLGVLHQLMHTFEASVAISWMQQAGFASEYEFIQARRLPQDEEALKKMLQEAANRLLDELEKMSLTQKSLNGQALAELQAFLAVRQ